MILSVALTCLWLDIVFDRLRVLIKPILIDVVRIKDHNNNFRQCGCVDLSRHAPPPYCNDPKVAGPESESKVNVGLASDPQIEMDAVVETDRDDQAGPSEDVPPTKKVCTHFSVSVWRVVRAREGGG